MSEISDPTTDPTGSTEDEVTEADPTEVEAAELEDGAAAADDADAAEDSDDELAEQDADAIDEGDEGDEEVEGNSSLHDRLEHEGDIAADYLEELLDIADLDGDLDMDVEGDRAAVSIVGDDLTQLVGGDGEVLEALQELTRLAVYRETGERSRLMLDIGGYRAEVRRARGAGRRDGREGQGDRRARCRCARCRRSSARSCTTRSRPLACARSPRASSRRRCVVILPAGMDRCFT